MLHTAVKRAWHVMLHSEDNLAFHAVQKKEPDMTCCTAETASCAMLHSKGSLACHTAKNGRIGVQVVLRQIRDYGPADSGRQGARCDNRNFRGRVLSRRTRSCHDYLSSHHYQSNAESVAFLRTFASIYQLSPNPPKRSPLSCSLDPGPVAFQRTHPSLRWAWPLPLSP